YFHDNLFVDRSICRSNRRRAKFDDDNGLLHELWKTTANFANFCGIRRLAIFPPAMREKSLPNIADAKSLKNLYGRKFRRICYDATNIFKGAGLQLQSH